MTHHWNKRFRDLAEHVATWSKDPSTKVGCVIVDHARIVIGTGYNGFPRGVQDQEDRYTDRETKYKFVVHAEANAILQSHRDVRGCALYATLHPCAECAKLIIQAGITEVHCPVPKLERWAKDVEIATTMFREADVDVYLYLEKP